MSFDCCRYLWKLVLVWSLPHTTSGLFLSGTKLQTCLRTIPLVDLQSPGAFRQFPAFQGKQMSSHFLAGKLLAELFLSVLFFPLRADCGRAPKRLPRCF